MIFFNAWSLIASVQNCYYNCHMKIFLTCINFVIIQSFKKLQQIGSPLHDFFHAWSLIVSVQNFYYKCYMNMFLTYMNFLMHLHWLWLCKLFEHLPQIDMFLHDFFMHHHWLWVCQWKFIRKFMQVKNIFMWQL